DAQAAGEADAVVARAAVHIDHPLAKRHQRAQAGFQPLALIAADSHGAERGTGHDSPRVVPVRETYPCRAAFCNAARPVVIGMSGRDQGAGRSCRRLWRARAEIRSVWVTMPTMRGPSST